MAMTEKEFQKYAEIIVRVGANVQPGQAVKLRAEVDQLPLVKAVIRPAQNMST